MMILFGLAQCDAQVLRASIPPNAQLRGAFRWDLVNHAPELSCPFYALSIYVRDDVLLLEPSLGCGAVRGYAADHNSPLDGELQLFGVVRGYFACLNTEPTRTFPIDKNTYLPGLFLRHNLLQLFNL